MGRMRAFVLSVAAASLTALAPGCTDAGTSMLIVQNQVPQDGCVVPSSQTSDFRSRGRIDVNAAGGYLFTPLVNSLVTETANGQGTRVIAVEGANVDLTFEPGFDASGFDSSLTSFSEAFSGSIFPGSQASFSFTVVPKALLDALSSKIAAGDMVQVTAKVKVFGTLDGGSVDSNSFDYPIDVCNGCLQIDNGSCDALPSNFTPATGGACNTLQDDPIDCCTDAGGALVCPAAPPAA